MNTFYPRLGQILRVNIPAILLAQLLIWPLVGLSFPHIGIIAAETTLLWFMALYIRRYHLSAEDLLLLNATSIPTLLLTVPLAICCSFVVAELDLYWASFLDTQNLAMPLSYEKNLLQLQVVNDFADVLKAVAALVLAPAFCEELFFRGFVLTGLCAHYGPRWALGGSAFLFAASHINPWQFIPLFVFGLFLGALVYWTHSIYPALLAHAINNLVSVAGINLHAYWGIESLGPSQHLPIPIALLATLLLFAGLFLLSRQSAIMPLLIDRPESKKEELPPAYPPSFN